MKKNLFLGLTLLGIVAIPALGFAACSPNDPAGCTAPAPDFVASIQKILNLLFWVVLLVSVIYLMIAGFKIITAGGDPKAMEGAMGAIRNGVIGIIIAVLAKGLSIFASTILG